MANPLFGIFMIGSAAAFISYARQWISGNKNKIPGEADANHGLKFYDAKRKCWFYYYQGMQLHVTDDEIIDACNRYNYYFRLLDIDEQIKFIMRVQSFIYHKNFYTVGFPIFKELPILIAATAVQITFGMDEYNLSHFKKVIVYPQEYLGFEPMRVLVGNVKGHTINLSWQHFLEDNIQYDDGKNLGLHEMAHALQVQHFFEQRTPVSEALAKQFTQFDRLDEQVIKTEKQRQQRLYGDHALRNENEFWATSIELFFEQPEQLYQQYPDLYQAIVRVLNQDILFMKQQSKKT